MTRATLLWAALVVALGAGAWGAYRFFAESPEHVERLARLRQLQVPTNGAFLYTFLMKEVPDVVSQIPCSCCGRTLNQCYGGACPLDCGPCNEQGRTAFTQFAHGRSVADIQKYMAVHYPVRVTPPGS